MTKDERLDFKSPKIVAAELAALGLAAWWLRYKYFRDQDEPGKPDPGGYPLYEIIDDAETFIHYRGDGLFTVGTFDPDKGYIQVAGDDAPSDPELAVGIADDVSESDPEKLEVLKRRMTILLEKWKELTQAAKNPLQSD